MRISWGPSSILLLIAVVCFALAALGIGVAGVRLTEVGLALGFAAFLVGGGPRI